MAGAPSSNGERRPWADLPADVLNAVADRLDLFAATRLAGVCTSWARAIAADNSLPLGTPCVLKSREDGRSDLAMRHGDCATFQLLDLTRSGGEELSVPALIPAMRHRRWIGGKDGWLATVDSRSNARLVNPYTGEQIDLPAVTTIPGVTRSTRLSPHVWEQIFRRIVVCTTPSGAGGYLAIAMLEKTDILALARGGGARWTALKKPGGDICYMDAVVHRGKVVAVTSSGDSYAWGILADQSPELLGRPPRHDRHRYEHRWNLAESADGRHLLLVCTYGNQVEYKRLCCNLNTYTHGQRFQAHGVRLFQRDVGGDGGWTPVISLGDYSLFVGASYPFMARVGDRHGSSSDCSECTEQVRANCVCVTPESSAFQGNDLEYDMEVFDLGDDSYRYHPRKLFPFSRYCNYQTPMWFRPTLKYCQLGGTI
ncbi:unnamed protein product [Urochloa decumbens]|uniref:F-box domain-containing protein n=1 Tax=Urochloa decumbens TaxID=240449 RepID=A0ABC9AGB6_9POAL